MGFLRSLKPPKPPIDRPIRRPIREVYLETGEQVMKLAGRAEICKQRAVTPEDIATSEDIFVACKLFAQKLSRSADRVVLIKDETTRHAFCREFDKIFKAFVDRSATYERDIKRLEKAYLTNEA